MQKLLDRIQIYELHTAKKSQKKPKKAKESQKSQKKPTLLCFWWLAFFGFLWLFMAFFGFFWLYVIHKFVFNQTIFPTKQPQSEFQH